MKNWTDWVKDEKTQIALSIITDGCGMDGADAREVLQRMWYESQDHIKEIVGEEFYKKYYPTDRHGSEWRSGRPRGVVDHYTTGVNARGVLRWFSAEPRGPDVGNSSSQVVIDRNGRIIFVINPLTHVAWHAPGVNNSHIGIEHVNAGLLRKAGDRYYRMRAVPYPKERIPHIQEVKGEYWEPYTTAQVMANIVLKRLFVAAVPTIVRENLVDHEMVNPVRKRDCGPLWPLERINDMAMNNLPLRGFKWQKEELLDPHIFDLETSVVLAGGELSPS